MHRSLNYSEVNFLILRIQNRNMRQICDLGVKVIVVSLVELIDLHSFKRRSINSHK